MTDANFLEDLVLLLPDGKEESLPGLQGIWGCLWGFCAQQKREMY